MVKRTTRKVRSSTKKSRAPSMGLKKLRTAFDAMERFVEALRPKAKHSFSDAVSEYRAEWHRVFKREISPADAAAYLKFRFGMKGKKAFTRRMRMRGGANHPIAGAPLEYSMRAGADGPYGQFPSYQSEGLDRYYGSAITADCGKANGFPTDGSAASQKGGKQKGGNILNSMFRPIAAASPSTMGYIPMMEFKGVKPYPSTDPVGPAPIRSAPTSYISNADTQPWNRSVLGEIFRK
jgi:hypothetical protein